MAGIKGKSGRTSLREELGILERYNQLSPKVFKFVSEMLDSPKKSDKQWAADWIKPAYAKMLPQQVSGVGGKPIEIQIVKYGDTTIQIPTATISDPVT